MRIAIQAVISDVEGQDTRTEIGVLEYNAEAVPASGLGLFIGEAHQLLRQLQTVVLREQAARFVERVSRCRQCGSRLGIKDSKTIVYRTVYGKAHLDSPRLCSTCGRCGARATPARSFSPLADALPERMHPQWLWLQSRYAAVMSYRQAQTFLRDAFPAGASRSASNASKGCAATPAGPDPATRWAASSATCRATPTGSSTTESGIGSAGRSPPAAPSRRWSMSLTSA